MSGYYEKAAAGRWHLAFGPAGHRPAFGPQTQKAQEELKLPLFRRGGTKVDEKVEEKTEQALTRTRRSWFGRIAGILDRGKIDEDLWLDLEEVLLGADVGVKTTEKILEDVRDRVCMRGFAVGGDGGRKDVFNRARPGACDAPQIT